MLVRKCDTCRREIKGEAVFASTGQYSSNQSFCLKCGKPVLNFLNKIKKNKNGKQKRK